MEMIGLDTNLLQVEVFAISSGSRRGMQEVVNEWLKDQHARNTHITIVSKDITIVDEAVMLVSIWYISHG